MTKEQILSADKILSNEIQSHRLWLCARGTNTISILKLRKL